MYDKAALMELVRKLALQVGEFKLASGTMSSYYLDCRKVTLDSAGANLIADGMLELMGSSLPDAVGGMAIGADPITAAIITVAGRSGKKLRGFIVRKDLKLKAPRGETPMHWIAMGLDPDLDEALKMAVREAIEFLVSEKHLSREDAYMLCSVGVDFNVTQAVDGTKGVHGMIPKSLFR